MDGKEEKEGWVNTSFRRKGTKRKEEKREWRERYRQREKINIAIAKRDKKENRRVIDNEPLCISFLMGGNTYTQSYIDPLLQ
jgi:hypothetical protein